MASAALLKSSFLPKKAEWGATRQAAAAKPVTVSMVVRASAYADELVKTAKTIASPGRGILAMDESNATCGKRLASIGLENTEANRQAYRTLLVTPPGLGNYISGAILFEETLYQSTVDGKKIVDILVEQGIVPGIKVDKGLVPLVGSNDESWCQGLDGLASREAAYYQQGARFAKWRTVVSIPNGPSELAVKEAAWGLARYAAISQDNGLVPIVEPEIMLDGEHGIERTFEVAQKVWAETFYYMAQNNVMFEGILLKPSMVTPGAECKDRATPEEVASYTLKLLQRRIPPSVPGIMVILVWWSVGGGGDAEPERDEPGAEPMARVLLLRAGAAEHLPQDVGRPAGERGRGTGGAAAARQGQLPGAARQVHQRRRGRGRQREHVRQELQLLIRRRAILSMEGEC
ncbi:fructose-bisphosphate aldolase, chloroplastic isoform X2 [Triticum aestivum]|uniref:fructose-bisphosphate aldolase, chloroplastic isoform X2 n=1 Tax=Triticum aestivum TaxID=4565 RepID=UPI001D02DC41|nr:fructose-bisphosphate aldolase, chloroplastic-like isoform X2 [Triticum aestivum]